MMRARHWLILSGILTVGAGFAACTGAEDTSPGVAAPAAATLPADLLSQSWVMQVSKPESLQRFEQNQGWARLISDRDIAGASKQLGSEGGIASARAHIEAAAMYRQASLLAANSLIQTYGKTPKEWHPAGTAHLLAVSYALTGDLDGAKAQAAKMAALPEDPSQKWHAPWKAWLDAGAAWPPDLAGLPVEWPPAEPGAWPEPLSTDHYELPVMIEGQPSKPLRVADPGLLMALSLWHERIAYASAPDKKAELDSWMARYRLPGEPKVDAPTDVGIELLFGSDYLVPADAAFMAAVHGPKGLAAVDEYAGKSAVAYIVAASRVDGKISPEKANDAIAELRKQLLDAQIAAAGGTKTGVHITFADIGAVGVMRNLALVAELEGNRETSGILRIGAKDFASSKATACPTATLSLSAWHAANRYTVAPAELLHNLINRYPSLETARFSLDQLSLAVSLESTGGMPGN